MPEKDPSNYAYATYAWVLFLSFVGGAVSFFQKLKMGIARSFNLTEFIGELVTSGFSGVLTFWLCGAADINGNVTAVLVGISGHMGSRAIFIIERILEQRLGLRNTGGNGNG